MARRHYGRAFDVVILTGIYGSVWQICYVLIYFTKNICVFCISHLNIKIEQHYHRMVILKLRNEALNASFPFIITSVKQFWNKVVSCCYSYTTCFFCYIMHKWKMRSKRLIPLVAELPQHQLPTELTVLWPYLWQLRLQTAQRLTRKLAWKTVLATKEIWDRDYIPYVPACKIIYRNL